MKKPKLQILAAVTLAFAAFTFGFLLGRNSCHGGVILEIPAEMESRPPQLTQPARADPEPTAAVSFPVDLNTAGREELMALPGIGEVLAQRILDFRRENGSFNTVEELMLVEGVGEKKLEQIIGKISIGG